MKIKTEENNVTSATSVQKWNTKSILAQSIAAAIVGTISLSCGMMYIFPPLIIGMTLESHNDIISLTRQEASWYGSALYLMLPVSSMLSGLLQPYVGRKRGMWLTCVSAIAALITTYNAKSFSHLMLSLGLTVISIGSNLPPSTAYLSDVAETRLRGVILSSMTLLSNMGDIIVFSLAMATSWRSCAIICACLPLFSTMLLFLIPESPPWLVSKRRKGEAIKALCWLRGWVDEECVRDEFMQLCCHHEESALSKQQELDTHPFINERVWQEENTQSTSKANISLWKQISHPSTTHPLGFMCCYIFFTTCSTSPGARIYFFSVFESVGSSTDSIGIVLGILSAVGNITSILLIKRVGKRRLSLTTMSLCSFFSILMGIYIRYKDVLQMPIIFSLLFYAFYYTFYAGIQIIPWTLMGEIFPQSTKAFGIAVSSTLLYVYFFISTKSYFYMVNMINNYGMFWMSGILGLLGCWFSMFYLPETEGKSMAEIEECFIKTNKQNTLH